MAARRTSLGVASPHTMMRSPSACPIDPGDQRPLSARLLQNSAGDFPAFLFFQAMHLHESCGSHV
jgi:hypothetical protein